MSKVLLTVAGMLMSFLAVAQEVGAAKPVETVSPIYIVVFLIAFIGLIAWFAFRMWQNERSKKAVGADA